MFRRCFFQNGYKLKTSAIEFTQANMMVRFASNEGHIIGTNLFGYYLAYYLSSQRAKRFV